jgi:hypothetical protein
MHWLDRGGARQRSVPAKAQKGFPEPPWVDRMRSTGNQGLVAQGLREAGQRSAMD